MTFLWLEYFYHCFSKLLVQQLNNKENNDDTTTTTTYHLLFFFEKFVPRSTYCTYEKQIRLTR